MKTIIPVLLVFAAIDLFLRKPDDEEISIMDELKTKSISELQFCLDNALDEEKYEYACILRDLINKKNKNGTKN
jgi:protein-arginine kinase activator protein McsA